MPFPARAYANVVNERLRPVKAPTPISINAEREKELRTKRKIDQAAGVLDRIDARTKQLQAQIKLLQRRKNALDARCERIEDRILTEMMDSGLKQATGLQRTFTQRPAPESLVVDDETLIPAEYLRESVLSAPDKVAIKQALAQGAEIGGVHLQQKISLVRK